MFMNACAPQAKAVRLPKKEFKPTRGGFFRAPLVRFPKKLARMLKHLAARTNDEAEKLHRRLWERKPLIRRLAPISIATHLVAQIKIRVIKTFFTHPCWNSLQGIQSVYDPIATR
jgi:hypothetical protein